MLYPKLKEIPTKREMVDVFKGYNHNLRIGDGEFYDMKNLSSDNYPILSPRQQRGIYAEPYTTEGPCRMLSKDSLCWVDGKYVFYAKRKAYKQFLTVDGKPKTLISMGAYLVVMPDKVYINTTDPSDCGPIEASMTTTGNVTYEMCLPYEDTYHVVHVSRTPPESPTNGCFWLDTAKTPDQLKQYFTDKKGWVELNTTTTTYIKISSTGIGAPFSEGDGVSIEGVASPSLQFLNGYTIIQERGDNHIVVTGVIDKKITQTGTTITVARKMPDMDFIIESGNRLWGCKYGKLANDKFVNEIYASKLGDFKNWNVFRGVSTDSYAASVGTDGPFTGATTHLGYPIFFKENCIHKVYGNYPANYQIQTTECRGVQSGCDRSIATVNEVLYYKSRSGICAYDGSLPMEVSSALGDVNYEGAVAGSLGNKYYISMKDDNAQWHLFVYDTKKGLWHREDDTHALDFCKHNGELYYIDYADKKIKAVNGSGTTETAPIKWEAITGIIGTDSPDKKYISRMDVRMSISVGTRVTFFAEYDSSGEWEYLYSMDGVKLQTFAVPISPMRCDHFRLKIIGNGDAKIFSICKTIEQGSDI